MTICHFWDNPEPPLPPPLSLPPLWVLDCGGLETVDEDDGDEVALAPFEAGVFGSLDPLDGVASGVPTATGKLDEPAETVDVDVAATAPPASLHAKTTAETPFGPLK